MAHYSMKKSSATNKGYGSKGSKRMSYNGIVKPILGSTKRTDDPSFRDYSPKHGNISAIAGYKQIGG